jgi:hypothetical protein
VHYYHNYAFRLKVTCLLLAIIFNYTIHRRVALSNSSPGLSVTVGLVSVLMWLTVVFSGLWIAFI